MTSEQEILAELHQINQQLSEIKSNADKTNVAFNSFSSGFFHSIGNILGFTLITLGTVYLSYKFGWDKMLLDSITKTFSQLVPGRL